MQRSRISSCLALVILVSCSSGSSKVVDSGHQKDGPADLREPRVDTAVAEAAGRDIPATRDVVIESPRERDTAEESRAFDASQARDVASVADAASLDTRARQDQQGADAVSDREDATTCSPLVHLAEMSLTPLSAYCPVDPTLSECQASDIGAIVYRDEICAEATRRAHSDCPVSMVKDASQELVIFRDVFNGCRWLITINSVRDCGDHVSIAYSVTRPCVTCDSIIPSAVGIIIANSPKPVRAKATLVNEDCSRP